MKKSVIVLVVAILLPLAAFADKKKQPPPGSTDITDWLNAPTPDGSPTLKQTSDWLAKTLQDYGGDWRHATVVSEVRIDNNCVFSYSEMTPKGPWENSGTAIDISFPLGAITKVQPSDEGADFGPHGIEFETGQVEAVRWLKHPQRGSSVEQRVLNQIDISLQWARRPQVGLGSEVPQTRQQVIPRIVSAFQHAVSLCQSTYKAPAQSKEPF